MANAMVSPSCSDDARVHVTCSRALTSDNVYQEMVSQDDRNQTSTLLFVLKLLVVGVDELAEPNGLGKDIHQLMQKDESGHTDGGALGGEGGPVQGGYGARADRFGMLEAKVDRMQDSIDAILEKLDSKPSVMPSISNMSMTALSPMQFLRKKDQSAGDDEHDDGGVGGLFSGLNGLGAGSLPFAGSLNSRAVSRETLPHFGEWEAQATAKSAGNDEEPSGGAAREAGGGGVPVVASAGETDSEFFVSCRAICVYTCCISSLSVSMSVRPPVLPCL